jgi:hypothetical protein
MLKFPSTCSMSPKYIAKVKFSYTRLMFPKYIVKRRHLIPFFLLRMNLKHDFWHLINVKNLDILEHPFGCGNWSSNNVLAKQVPMCCKSCWSILYVRNLLSSNLLNLERKFMGKVVCTWIIEILYFILQNPIDFNISMIWVNEFSIGPDYFSKLV